MAAEHWFRWHHGTVNDPKWKVIASRAGHALSRHVTVGHVVSVWAAMLECASQANPRGTLTGWDDEDVAAGLEMQPDEVAAIRASMQGKTLDGDELSGWKRRQVKVEDATAAERKRRQREREAGEKAPTPPHCGDSRHGMSRPVTTETETEKSKKPPIPPTGGTPDADPEDESAEAPRRGRRSEAMTFGQFVEACHADDEKLIPADHAVFGFAVDAGIPRSFLELAWAEFSRQYRDGRKTQAGKRGWRQKFENCVRRNWFKLWWFPAAGECELTTSGVQLKREREAQRDVRPATDHGEAQA